MGTIPCRDCMPAFLSLLGFCSVGSGFWFWCVSCSGSMGGPHSTYVAGCLGAVRWEWGPVLCYGITLRLCPAPGLGWPGVLKFVDDVLFAVCYCSFSCLVCLSFWPWFGRLSRLCPFSVFLCVLFVFSLLMLLVLSFSRVYILNWHERIPPRNHLGARHTSP